MTDLLVSVIKPDPNQPRKFISPDHIDGLAKSLRSVGLINPIEVDVNNLIVTGEARWRAAKQLGWKKIEARQIDPGSGPQRFLRQVNENLHQGGIRDSIGMQPMDAARAFEKLLMDEEAGLLGPPIPAEECECCKSFVYPVAETGRPEGGIRALHRRIGRTKDYILQRLNFLDLDKTPKPVQEALSDGRLPFTTGRSITRAAKEWKLPIFERVEREQKKGKVVQAHVVDAVVGAINSVRDKPTQNQLLDVIVAGKTEAEAKKEIGVIAPTFTEAVEQAREPGTVLRLAIVRLRRQLDELLPEVAPIDRAEVLRELHMLQDTIGRLLEGRPEARLIEGTVVG